MFQSIVEHFRNVRRVFHYWGVIVILFWVLADPDLGYIQNLPFGASTVNFLMLLARSVMIISLGHFARKKIFYYIDFREYAEKAKEGSVGAGLVCLAMGMFYIAMILAVYVSVEG